MPLLMIKDLPRYECLLEASREFPDLDPSATEVFLTLLRSGDEVIRAVESSLAGHDITQGRFGVLMALWTHRRRDADAAPLTPAELAELTGVTRATITGLVDTLERAGLVKRQPAMDDRRMTTVHLTPAGDALLNDILPGHFQLMATLMESLSDSERSTLLRLLHKILQRAGSVADGSPAPAGCSARVSSA
jgi:DNA-binding MarR family transcriptional regulator